MLRFLPLAVVFVVVISILTFTPFRRELAYSVGLSGDPTASCCDEAEVEKSLGNFDERANLAVFNNNLVEYPKTSLAQSSSSSEESAVEAQVLGTTNPAGEEKWIEVHLGQQMLRAWEGNKIVKEFAISSGKWFRTPKGTFHIWYKTRYQAMKGGSKALGTYYYLPNVPSNMFFYKGYALHGAYWHNNFGTPMSHGCVNEPLAQAAELFEWAGPVVPEGQNYVKASAENPGTKVFVH